MNSHQDFEKIAKFLGYKLAPCRNGQAWESPFQFAKDDVYKLHGRLFPGDCNPDHFKSRDNLFYIINVIKETTQVEIIINPSYNFCNIPFRDISETGKNIEEAIYKAIIKYVNL